MYPQRPAGSFPRRPCPGAAAARGVKWPHAMPLCTFLSDFGLADTYVAQVKGVLCSRVDGVTVVDVTHAIEPGDVFDGCLALESILGSFPPATVHLAVVDPGVGGGRRGIAVATAAGFGVGPDNGLLTPLLEQEGARVHEIRGDRLGCRQVAPTFHGRDLFAPACGHLLAGGAIAELGPPVEDPIRLRLPAPRPVAGGLDGEVVHVDRFGNCTTSIRATDLTDHDPDRLRVAIAGVEIQGLVRTYTEGRAGEPIALIGSGGRLEVALRDGSVADHLAVARATPVMVRW